MPTPAFRREHSKELFLNSGSDWTIRNERGKVITPAEARASWENGTLENFNLAFQRLTQCDFDIERVKAYYAQQKAK